MTPCLALDRLGDLSGYPLDGPVPEPRDPAFKSRAEVMYRQAHVSREIMLMSTA
jgi:hypothetical protein